MDRNISDRKLDENNDTPGGPESDQNRPGDLKTELLDSEYLLRRTLRDHPEKGFELLFKRYYSGLCNHAMRFVQSREIAEDIVSELFAMLWQNKGYEAIHISYRTYLYKAIRHRSYNYLKWQLSRTTPIESIDYHTIEDPINPDQTLQYTELYQRIEEAIARMPARCKRAYLLKQMESKKNAEIAAEMEISTRSVESLISRALALIRTALSDKRLLLALATASAGASNLNLFHQ